jgi:hypothetical protein
LAGLRLQAGLTVEDIAPEVEATFSELYRGQAFEISLSPQRTRRVFSDMGHKVATVEDRAHQQVDHARCADGHVHIQA